MKSFLVVSLLASVLVGAEQIPIGIAGGREESLPVNAYGALVQQNGYLFSLPITSQQEPGTRIDAVAINNSGIGLIVGGNFPGAYAALVSPNGGLTFLSGAGFPSADGAFYSAAINNSGMGIIGGQNEAGGQPAYAALVSPNGTLTELSGGDFPSVEGVINSVAINEAGFGIIGGQSFAGSEDPAYAALVSPSGVLTNLPAGVGGLPTTGYINSVAINNSGKAIIGGQNQAGGQPAYAALVSPNGALTLLSGGGFPSTEGTINGVAMNDSGIGLIGGQDNTGSEPAYAALVSASGTLTQLSGGNFPSNQGLINEVAINSSGEGIIGGQNQALSAGGVPYAALVSPQGVLRSVSGQKFLSGDGIISSAAINNAGIGLIGGQVNGESYLALVAPNGTLTELSGAGFPFSGNNPNIFSVAINDAATPTSIAPYFGAINTQLAASYALESHFTSQTRAFLKNRQPKDQIALLAGEFPEGASSTASKEPKYCVWGTPFGNYVHQKQQGNVPCITNEVAGMLAGCDYHPSSDILVGGALGYAYNYMHYANSLGHGNIQEEMASLYGSFTWEHVWMNAALWGGLYQLHNKRHMLSFITSTTSTHGWILAPHIEVAARLGKEGFCSIEPFVLFDWVNNWQNGFTEQGTSGFNLVVPGLYNSLLRSEIGLRFYEEVIWEAGRLLLEEKASYVNQAPFHVQNANVAFVSSASIFPIATGSTSVQNLGGVAFRASFFPSSGSYPYVALNLQGELGTDYQSYFAGIEIGKNF